MSDLLTDAVAVITGGSSGNGRAIGRLFAEEGADVVIADVRDSPREGGTPTHDLIETETDASATFVECDVTSIADLESAVATADEFGGVDVMVNNAGIFRSEEFIEVSEAEYHRLMDINVKGTFFGTQIAAKRMLERDATGSIINLSSIAGLRGSAAHVTYCTSKGAVRLMTYAQAARLGPEDIRVNAIHPGIIETAMTTEDVPIIGGDNEAAKRREIPLGRFGTPGHVANVALFLASDLAEYVNGESIVLDGGQTSTAMG